MYFIIYRNEVKNGKPISLLGLIIITDRVKIKRKQKSWEEKTNGTSLQKMENPFVSSNSKPFMEGWLSSAGK